MKLPSHPQCSRLSLLLALAACGSDPRLDTAAAWQPDRDFGVGLSVTVRDEAGAPLEGAWVSLGARDQQTGADGVALLTGLVVAEGDLVVAAPGYSTWGPASVSLAAEDTDQTVTLTRIDALAGLEGQVTGPGPWAAGVAGATLWLNGDLVATADAEGRFSAEGLEPGDWDLRIEPPSGADLLAWWADAVPVEAGARAPFGVRLAARPPESATYVGAETCALCHYDQAHPQRRAAHGAASTEPADLPLGLAGLEHSVEDGARVALDAAVPGAWVQLSGSGGAWTAEIGDASGNSTGALPVVEVYGGWRWGAALAVEAGGERALLPAAWALEGAGLSALQDPEGWVGTWTDGWFDASGALDLDADGRPGPEAAYDLQCAGCHATGHRLEESADAGFRLAARGEDDVMERVVGCEACHGPGSAHVHAADDARDSTILNPARLAPPARIELCARCHEATATTDHPFSAAPGWPVLPDGEALSALDLVGDYAEPNRDLWDTVAVSRGLADQVGDLRSSPHQGDGYLGACEDCHLAHDPGDGPALRVARGDNALCTDCHAAAFPDADAVLDHAHHPALEETRFGSASCQGCHVPRLNHRLRPDALSGAGEGHAHSLIFVEPQAAVDAFDGARSSPLGTVPTPACLDCHLERAAAAEERGGVCVCLAGDPELRSTYEDLQWAFEQLFGEEP